MTEPIMRKDKDLVSMAIKAMLLFGAVALAYVILRSCSTPKTGVERFADGSLSRLVALQSPPAIPSLSFTGPNAEPVNLKAMRGQPMIVNIWATWCAPCIAELPSLNQLSRDYAGRIKVVAISVDRDAGEAQGFLDKIGATALPLYHDNSFAVASKDGLAANGIPLTVMYNAGGREIARVQGEADWQSPEAERFLEYFLAQ